MLFTPAPTLSDVTYEDYTWSVTGEDESTLKTSNLGWRFGLRFMNMKRSVSWGWAFDVGSRPGLEGKGLFLNWSLTFPVIGLKIPSLG